MTLPCCKLLMRVIQVTGIICTKIMTKATFTSKKYFPRIWHILYILLAVVVFRVSYYWLTDGFSVSKIKNTFPQTCEWQLDAPSASVEKQLHEICKGSFSYLAKGSQSYAFISEDKKYVLKLFKCYHLKPVNWIAKLPMPQALAQSRDEALAKRYKKISLTLQSYKLAATEIQEECGLVALEILPTKEIDQEVTLYDKLGRKHRINLGQYGFILQKRADLIYPRLSHWIATGDMTSAKRALQSIVAIIVERSKKGIQDSDPDLHKNAGLIGTTAVFIDLGSFHANPDAKNEAIYKADLYKITNRLREWLEKQSPELAAFLKDEIENSSRTRWKAPGTP